MDTLLVSSKGQVVLPAALRRRLGMGPGARLEVIEEAGDIRLRVVRSAPHADVSAAAGMLKARPIGKPRSLFDFDPASVFARDRIERSR